MSFFSYCQFLLLCKLLLHIVRTSYYYITFASSANQFYWLGKFSFVWLLLKDRVIKRWKHSWFRFGRGATSGNYKDWLCFQESFPGNRAGKVFALHIASSSSVSDILWGPLRKEPLLAVLGNHMWCWWSNLGQPHPKPVPTTTCTISNPSPIPKR